MRVRDIADQSAGDLTWIDSLSAADQLALCAMHVQGKGVPGGGKAAVLVAVASNGSSAIVDSYLLSS